MFKVFFAHDMVTRYYVDSSSLTSTMSSLQDQSGQPGSTSYPEPPHWAREIADSIATRPSRASSLISTRTRFSTTTFQEDAKSIDLSVSGHHFRISRDGSKVTSVNSGESLPPYPFSPVQDSSQNNRPAYRYVAMSSGSEIDVANEPVEDFVESQGMEEGEDPPPAQDSIASPAGLVDSGTPDPGESEVNFPLPLADVPEHFVIPDHGISDRQSGLGGPSDRTKTPNTMAIRIQRAWRNYVHYRGPLSKPGEPMSFVALGKNELSTVTQSGPNSQSATIPQQARISPHLRRGDAAPGFDPVTDKSKSILDKELPIPGEASTGPVRDTGLSHFTSVVRRPESRVVDRGSLVPHNRLLPVADRQELSEPLSLRKWFTGEDSRRFRDMDGPAPSPVVRPPEAMDSENDVSNHYTRMIRFIDRDHRRALHARDKEMAELRERLNEKDIVYRQELRARDFLIEDLKQRLDHLEEQTEAEIERARNAVEDLWESRWKDRDFHLRERMQRMEAELQKTMDLNSAEREAAWSAKYEELRRTLETSEGSLDD